MKTLITGATGQLGSLVVKHLLDHLPANQIAVSVRTPAKADQLATQGIDVRHGDFDDLALMTTAFKGIDTVLIISAEADNATRIAQHRTAVDAAKAAGVRHLVYTSIVNPRADADFTYSAIHLDTENYIKASGLDYTLLRNSFYADLLLAGVPHALETGAYGAPAGDAKITYIPRNDLAEAAATVLANPAAHINKIYDLTGGKAVTHTEIAGYIAKATGKDIQFADLPADVHVGILNGIGLPGHLVEALAGLYVGAKKGDYETVSKDFEKLVGRKPQSVEDFIAGALK
ncbi:SDR family oxidoreductase [Thalassospira profundimaris]|uniref:Nucleoside-diphosphate sugar epimerase n=1 Tax=Thalassospira profundimaris TaxID=502049 RepID=A0A367WTB8_9PROT|nr:SDR family oxidoreductase [Thalassospira profundimaris]RCK44638.1 nucleoside-diphosphate sugar epimerase [Thalassospira profundimaris]